MVKKMDLDKPHGPASGLMLLSFRLAKRQRKPLPKMISTKKAASRRSTMDLF